MKAKFMKATASLVSLVASISAGTLCAFIFNQPKVPAKLLNK